MSENSNGGQQGNEGTGDGDQGGDDKGTGGAGSAESLRADLVAERRARQAAEKRATDLEAEKTKRDQDAMSEHEKALEKARKEARDEGSKEATTKANARIVRAEVRRLAAEKFADPGDPIGALDLSQFSVDDDGNVDEKAVKKELDDLLKSKPHWAKSNSQRQSHGSGDGGARGTGSQSRSMNDLIRQKARS